MLSVSGLHYARGQRTILRDIHGTIQAGEITALVGPNGAGKSTLLRCLHQAHPAIACNIPPQQRALVLQKPIILRRSVGHYLRFMAPDGDKAAQQAALQAVQLDVSLRQGARRLSQGQQQKLAFAAYCLRRPQLWLLDEPTSSLDPHTTLAIETLLCQRRDQGEALLLVSHNLAQVRRLASRVWVLADGELVEQGTMAVLDHPQHAKSRAYLHHDRSTD